MSKCPICDQSSEYRPRYTRTAFDFKTEYQITECSSCTATRTEPVPSNLSDLYAEIDYQQPQSGLYHLLKNLLVRLELGRIRNLTKSRHYLDIGSGYGDFTKTAHELKFSIVAADGSPHRPVYLKDATEIPYVQFNFSTASLADPSLVKGRVVILRHVVEHLPEPRAFLQKFIDEKAAFFYIAVPNWGRWERSIFGQYDLLLALPYHLWHFNKRSLHALGKGLGLEIVKTGYDTIPTVWNDILLFLTAKKFPAWVTDLWQFPLIKYPFWLTLNIFSPNNVIWIVAKVPGTSTHIPENK